MALPPLQQAHLRIDPRIRRRRIEVKRSQGRRRLRLLLLGTGVIGLSAGGWGATRSPLLDVDHIRVVGASRTPAGAVVEAAGVRRHQAMVDVDVQASSARVKSLPWVDEAHVHRLWPGGVVISVTERRPVAVTSADGATWAVLDPSGRVLDVASSAPPGLMSIEGLTELPAPGGTAARAKAPLSLLAALTPALRARTAAVVLAPGGQVELKLNPRGIVRLGPPDQLEAKVRAAETVLASVDLRNLAVLDVRLPASPVLTRG
jgi:cell division protein FtsQ